MKKKNLQHNYLFDPYMYDIGQQTIDRIKRYCDLSIEKRKIVDTIKISRMSIKNLIKN